MYMMYMLCGVIACGVDTSGDVYSETILVYQGGGERTRVGVCMWRALANRLSLEIDPSSDTLRLGSGRGESQAGLGSSDSQRVHV